MIRPNVAVAFFGLAILLAFLAPRAQAAVADGAYIEGIITDFNDQWVTVFSEGNVVLVPRSSIPGNLSIRAGYPVVSYQNAEDALRAEKADEETARHRKQKKKSIE